MKVRYYGHQGEGTGYAKAAELNILALRTVGVEVDDISYEEMRSGPVAGKLHDHELDAVIVHGLPLDAPRTWWRLLETYGTRATRPLRKIAYTYWEAIDCPRAVIDPLTSTFDEIWTSSNASARALNGGHDLNSKAVVVPPPYLVRLPLKRNPEGRYRFYWIGAWTTRKNPSGLIRAFCHAFSAADDVELVLHSPGASTSSLIAELVSTGLEQNDAPSVRLSSARLTDEEIWGFHAQGDCFVSAARGEAWNLPAFDAMMAGKRVLITAGLGSDDFLQGTDHAVFVDAATAPMFHTLKTAVAAGGAYGYAILGIQGMTVKDRWLDPYLCQMANLMRRIYTVDRKKQPEDRVLRTNYDVADRYSMTTIGDLMVDRINRLLKDD